MPATFVLLAASPGERRGERVVLRWRDLDLKRRSLRIERGLILAGDVRIEQGTKTHSCSR
jgi:integrase